MATKPKPKPEPEPDEPDPPEADDDDAAALQAQLATEVSVVERIEKLENRMTTLEERVAAPPVGIGRRP